MNTPTPGASADPNEIEDARPLLPMRMHPVLLALVALADVMVLIWLARTTWGGELSEVDAYWWAFIMMLSPVSCCIVPTGVWLWMIFDRSRHGAAGWRALSRARIATECAIMAPMAAYTLWGLGRVVDLLFGVQSA